MGRNDSEWKFHLHYKPSNAWPLKNKHRLLKMEAYFNSNTPLSSGVKSCSMIEYI